MPRWCYRLRRTIQRWGTELRLNTYPLIGPLARWLFNMSSKLLFIPFKAPEFVKVRGFTLRWPPEETGEDLMSLLFDEYEPATTLFFEYNLRPGMTVVDVGAHVGYYTLLAARSVGEAGRVYAFEPSPENFQFLKENVVRNGFRNVYCIAKAVYDKNTEVELFLSDVTSGQHSIFGYTAGFKRSVRVQTITLDSFFSELGWPAVDLVKIDVEGAEGAVFRGMKELVRRNPMLKLIWELNPGCQKMAGNTVEDLFATLAEMGFHHFSLRTHKVIPLHVPKDLKWLIHTYGNILVEQ